jgi:hypothetical protein
MKKEIMKNLFWLICILLFSYSCKQTQLALSNNKKSDKIYTKAPLSLNDIDFVSKEKKASKPSRSIIITKAVKKQLYSTENSIERELFTDLDNTKPNLIKNEKRIHQKLIRIDSILKSQVSNLENEEEVLDLSKKAKKYSLISIINLLLTAPLAFIALFTGGTKPGFEILSLLFGISTFIFSTISLFFLIKSIKEIKKSGKEFKETDSTIKKNLRIGIFGAFLCLIPTILFASVLIWFACCFDLSL